MKTCPPPGRPGGSALIITLFFLGIITVIILASLVGSRLERSAAYSHLEQMRAEEFAREGVERSIAVLQQQTAYKYQTPDPISGQPTYRYRNYLTQPGGLVVPAATPSGTNDPSTGDSITQNILSTAVPLSTGLSTLTLTGSDDPALAPASLNIPTFVQPPSGKYTTYTVVNRSYTPASGTPNATPSAMKLKWVYLRQDNTANPPALTSETAERPAFDKQRPIVGRFAYWTDDESTKINYNLAWKKSLAAINSDPDTANKSFALDPSHVSLSALLMPGSVPGPTANYFDQADALHTWTTKTPGRYFNSFQDARQVDATAVSPVLDYNNSDLTHYNHDPDTTFFGEDRILLTTDPRLVPKIVNPDGTVTYLRKFLDILREDAEPTLLRQDSTPGAPTDFQKNPPDPGSQRSLAARQLEYGQTTEVPSGSTNYPGQTVTNKFDMVIRNLVRYINQKNWPIVPASFGPTATFRRKYYPSASDAADAANGAAVAQLAVAIIDYVRSRESSQQVVSYTRFAYGKPDPATDTSNVYTTRYSLVAGTPTGFQGTCRTPLVTELGIMFETTASGGVTQCEDGSTASWPLDNTTPTGRKTLYRAWAKCELYLPTRYSVGVDSQDNPLGIELVPNSDPTKGVWSLGTILNEGRYVEGYNHVLYRVTDGGNAVPITTKNLTIFHADGSTGGTILKPGEWAVIIVPYYRDTPYSPSSGTNQQTAPIRVSLGRGKFKPDGVYFISSKDDVGAQLVPQSTAIRPVVSPYTAGGSVPDPTILNIQSFETDDPRCNVSANDWAAPPAGGPKNSWGKKNIRWSADRVSDPTGFSPSQDMDTSGNYTSYSLYMPPPKDPASKDPQNGRVTSVAELGYITTGLSATVASVPWRTLHLQPGVGPTSGSGGTLPDWAMMDLFAAPTLPTPPTPETGPELHSPHGNMIGGRVNLNATVTPFTDVNRDRALAALFHDAHNPKYSKYDIKNSKPGTPTAYTTEEAQTLAQNVATQAYALGNFANGPGNSFGAMNSNPVPAGTTPRNLYDSPGEICEIKGIADGGEASEDLVREIASLICTRGGVFSIYTVGQAVKQDATGKLTVTGERRQQTVVERQIENWNTGSAADDQIRFRTIYSRSLTP